jgi:acyl CoA:acetate/3-ketoacid CoA transferase
MGPMSLKRFLDPTSKRTAVLHPPNVPDQTMVVHVDRLVKAEDRPPHLVQIPLDLADWIKKQEEVGKVQEAEMNAEPQVTHVQRRAADVEKEEWASRGRAQGIQRWVAKIPGSFLRI